MSIAGPQSDLITREGYERLRAELEHLVGARRPELERWLRSARDGGAGDAAVAEALDEQARLERRIDELELRLALAEIVVPRARGTAGIGARVTLRLHGGREVVYELVGVLEADPAAGRVSIESPVGEALLGRRPGEIVDVETPGGLRGFEILAVDHPVDEIAA